MTSKTKENLDKPTIEENPQFAEPVGFSEEPDKNIQDSWNQITLSLASNGGYTLPKGSKYILYVYLKQTVNDKQVYCVKSFLVTRKELESLQNDSNEFRSEIDRMLEARDQEETKLIIKDAKDVKDKDVVKKKEDKKRDTKALSDILKKTLDNKIKDMNIEDPDDIDYNKDKIIID